LHGHFFDFCTYRYKSGILGRFRSIGTTAEVSTKREQNGCLVLGSRPSDCGILVAGGAWRSDMADDALLGWETWIEMRVRDLMRRPDNRAGRWG
jgi:hypothetical protein